MHPQDLSKLPSDVLLYIIGFCELVDAAVFSMVCKTFHTLSETHRAFWIVALQNERLVRPIACPFHEDLTKHDLRSLKRIALHTLRLERNWSRREPGIMGPIKAVSLGSPGQPTLDVIFQVPGTELYLFHSQVTGTVVAWDIGLGKPVTPPVYISKKILDVSPGQDQPGRFSMGLLTSETSNTINNKLIVVCLEYGPAGVAITQTLEHVFESHIYHWAVFMSPDFVGVLRCDPRLFPDDSTIHIIALNISTGKKTVIITDINRDEFPFDGQSGTSILNGDLSILVEYMDESYVYTCPKAYFPHGGNPDCPPQSTLKCAQHRIPMPIQRHQQDIFQPEGVLSADSFYGVPAVSLQRIERAINGGPASQHTEIKFWTAVERGDNTSRSSAPIIYTYCTVAIPGILQDSEGSSWQLMLLPHSGRKVLLVMNHEEHVELQLVNFKPETNEASVHNINLPPFINLSSVYGLSLDDHRGVITLLDTMGTLYAIPYA